MDHARQAAADAPQLDVPLPAAVVDLIVRAVEPFEYERVYGAFWDTVIERDGKAAVARSAGRYRQAIRGGAN